MDTGKIKDNYTFFEGFDDEPEIVIEAEKTNMQTLHIWYGYFDDILRKPNLDGNGWSGFTRDYHQCEGAFGNDSEGIITNLSEYLNDLELYRNCKFDYDETRNVYDLLYSWFKDAIKNRCKRVIIKVI